MTKGVMNKVESDRIHCPGRGEEGVQGGEDR